MTKLSPPMSVPVQIAPWISHDTQPLEIQFVGEEETAGLATCDALETNTIRGKVDCRRCDVITIIVRKKLPLSRENFALFSR
jgi:hypothetical protein